VSPEEIAGDDEEAPHPASEFVGIAPPDRKIDPPPATWAFSSCPETEVLRLRNGRECQSRHGCAATFDRVEDDSLAIGACA
jgi:hypothetical protein